ncbi:MAG: NUDIX hydrolase [Planctomycetaceae bacterium]|jgi:ADP-ribose pyrophosphatase|nr:NUDIX hydrolase [Planctomycetaceae bacterium]
MDILFTSKLFKVVRKFTTGRSGTQLERHIIEHPGAVVILPILPDGRIVLIKQPRVAVDEELIELPAGTREPAEQPLVTARRELVEETGYTAGEMTEIFRFYASPGFIKEEMYLFKAEKLVAGPTNLEDGEKITPLIVDLPEAMQMVQTGQIRDAKTLIGLLWYNQNGQQKSS